MPGSPYLEDKPRGLWTWPSLMKWAIPFMLLSTFSAYWLGYLVEWIAGLTILSFVRFFIKG